MNSSPFRHNLTPELIDKGLNKVIGDGLAGQALATLSGGAYLTAFLLALGANNLVIGLLAAIPPSSQFMQIPAIFLLESVRKRRLISTISVFSSRIFLAAMAVIPLLMTGKSAIAIFLLLLWLHNACNAIAGLSWSSWMRDLIPEEMFGRFFARRMSLTMAVNIVLNLSAGLFIDYWMKNPASTPIHSYSILFGSAFFIGMFSVYFLATTPEPEMRQRKKEIIIHKLILQPLKNKNYRKLIIFLASWNFASNLAAPFFTVYMLRRLSFNMSWIIGLTIVHQMMNVLFVRIWGKLIDRFSNKSVLSLSGFIFIVCILGWAMTALPEKYGLTIPYLIGLHMFMGISTAGLSLSSSNIVLKLSPQGRATNYLAVTGFINSSASILASILGGVLADLFSQFNFSITFEWASPSAKIAVPALFLRQWEFLFIFSFIIGFLSLHRLAFVHEVGHVKEKIVLRETFLEILQSLRVISSATGLRQLLQFTFSWLFETKGGKESNDDKHRPGGDQ